MAESSRKRALEAVADSDADQPASELKLKAETGEAVPQPPRSATSDVDGGHDGAEEHHAATTRVALPELRPEPGSLPYDRHTPNYKPENVQVVPTVQEITEVYRIIVGVPLADQTWLNGDWKPTPRPLLVEERMLNGGFCDARLVMELWTEKRRLDSFFDVKEDSYYYRARNSVFPQDQKGSSKYRNRAGDKLYEVSEWSKRVRERESVCVCVFVGLYVLLLLLLLLLTVLCPLWQVHDETGLFSESGGVFFDVCGGPGAWSEVLLKEKKQRWSGFGMTLKLPNTPMSDMWYDHLMRNHKWQPLWGVDGTGNVYNHKNLEHAQEEVLRLGRPVTLVMGDGGFHISTNEAGDHMEHLQELYSARIILSELLACLKCVSDGGNFCCKLFDTFSTLTARCGASLSVLLLFVLRSRCG